jgi:hypothetical protein
MRFLNPLFVFLAGMGLLASPATASMVEIPITPTNLATQDFVFSGSTNAVQGAVIFHITVTNTQADIFADSFASVAFIHHKRFKDGGLEISGEAVKPPILVNAEKKARVWKTEFSVPRELLKNPDLFFSFGFTEHIIINGRVELMPSVSEYRLKLQDFVKP